MLSIVACNKNTTQSISQTSNPSTTQTALPKNITYNGYRLELVNISVKEEKGNLLRVIGTIINTGRNKVVLPSKHSNELVIKFDHSLEEAGYMHLSDDIKNRLLKQKINLEPGQMAYDTSLGVKKVEKSPFAEVQKEVLIAKEEELVVQEENTTPQKEEVSITKNEDPSPEEEVSITKNKDPNPEEEKEEEFVAKGSSFLGEDTCPDLVIESFKVTKRKKKYAEITYIIANKGTCLLYTSPSPRDRG